MVFLRGFSVFRPRVEHCQDPTDIHLYFIAGLCDLTVMDRFYLNGERYEEVYFTESKFEAVERMTKAIDEVTLDILAYRINPNLGACDYMRKNAFF